MKIVNFNNIEHNITFVPRFFYYDLLILNLYNEITGVEFEVPFNSFFGGGFMSIVFNFNFKRNDRFSFKLQNDLKEIIYRGKIFCTIDNPQNYKQSTDLYEY